MTRFVGVHGIWQQQKGRHQLIAHWGPALADGLERETGVPVDLPHLDIAFYGHLFTPAAVRGSKAEVDDTTWQQDWDDDEVADLSAAVHEMVSEQDLAAADASLDGVKGMPGMPLWWQRLAKAVDVHVGIPVGMLFLGELRQVRRYLCEPDLRQKVDEIVAGAVGADCAVLIGHSLGSVVALEYVRQNPDHKLDLLLTLGSPLALRMVRNRLPGTVTAVAAGLPRSVAAWVNVRDPRDPVALAGDLRPWWTGVIDIAVNNGGDNAHAVERYLSKKAVGGAIVAAVPGWTP